MRLVLTQQITQADSDLDSTATVIFSVKAGQLSAHFSWAGATGTLVSSNVDQSNPRCVPVNDTNRKWLFGHDKCLLPFFLLPLIRPIWGTQRAFPQSMSPLSSLFQCGAEQRCSAEGIWFQVYWATASILWPSQPIHLPFGNCNWFYSFLHAKTISTLCYSYIAK